MKGLDASVRARNTALLWPSLVAMSEISRAGDSTIPESDSSRAVRTLQLHDATLSQESQMQGRATTRTWAPRGGYDVDHATASRIFLGVRDSRRGENASEERGSVHHDPLS